MKINDTLIGLIRTWVPIGVGAAISWLATNGLELDEETRTAAIVATTGAIQALYYTVVRLLENKVPAVGWLLGSAKTPTYGGAEVVYVEVPVPVKAPAKKAEVKKAPVAKKAPAKKTTTK
jgi:hypothetical protein